MNENNVFDKEFLRDRIRELRNTQGVTDRAISVAIGRSDGYIHNILSGRSFPSFADFINICNFFKIEPKDFFDNGVRNPMLINDIVTVLRNYDEDRLKALLLVLQTPETKDNEPS
jgi:transcriptional regulator with XRE-family HTH domain